MRQITGKEYKELKARFDGKKPESIIQMIEKFVTRHGTTPPEAASDLSKYKKMLFGLYYSFKINERTKAYTINFIKGSFITVHDLDHAFFKNFEDPSLPVTMQKTLPL